MEVEALNDQTELTPQDTAVAFTYLRNLFSGYSIQEIVKELEDFLSDDHLGNFNGQQQTHQPIMRRMKTRYQEEQEYQTNMRQEPQPLRDRNMTEKEARVCLNDLITTVGSKQRFTGDHRERLVRAVRYARKWMTKTHFHAFETCMRFVNRNQPGAKTTVSKDQIKELFEVLQEHVQTEQNYQRVQSSEPYFPQENQKFDHRQTVHHMKREEVTNRDSKLKPVEESVQNFLEKELFNTVDVQTVDEEQGEVEEEGFARFIP